MNRHDRMRDIFQGPFPILTRLLEFGNIGRRAQRIKKGLFDNLTLKNRRLAQLPN